MNTVIYYSALRGIDYLSNAVAVQHTETKPTKEAPKKAEDDVDDDDLFGGVDEEELAAVKKKHETEQKGKKKEEIQKSNVIFDVKPLGSETDLSALEAAVRSISIEGLTWGPSKLVPVAYGVKKLQISSVVLDDKVSTDDVEEEIMKNEDLVQSVDIVAFVKV